VQQLLCAIHEPGALGPSAENNPESAQAEFLAKTVVGVLKGETAGGPDANQIRR
jgi:hypothetical protein